MKLVEKHIISKNHKSYKEIDHLAFLEQLSIISVHCSLIIEQNGFVTTNYKKYCRIVKTLIILLCQEK